MRHLVHNCLLFLGMVFVLGRAYEILSEYHQNDYDVKLERCVLTWCNLSVFRNMKIDFVPYNRTQRALNFSFFTLLDFTGAITTRVQMYKFLSNEYRFFPLTVEADICEHFHKNSFGVRDLLKNISNAGSCPWKKGYYYGYNILPDFSKLPPYIPRGAYKMEIQSRQSSYPTFNVDAFFIIKDKPLKWN